MSYTTSLDFTLSTWVAMCRHAWLTDRLLLPHTKHVQLRMCLLRRCSTSSLVDWTSSPHSLHSIPLLFAVGSGTESSALVAWETERSRPSTHSLTSENYGLYVVSLLSTLISNCSRYFLLFLNWNFCTATNAHQQTLLEPCSSSNMCWLLSFHLYLDLPPIHFLWEGHVMAQAVSHGPLTMNALGSIPGQSMWCLWWIKRQWDKFSCKYIGFSHQSLSTTLYTHSFICPQCYIILATDSTVQWRTLSFCENLKIKLYVQPTPPTCSACHIISCIQWMKLTILGKCYISVPGS